MNGSNDNKKSLAGHAYGPPVARLLRTGESMGRGKRATYAARGIGREHVPDLIHMATDKALHTAPPESPLAWAPIHACWALAELRAEEAIVPLISLLRRVDTDEDNWINEDLPYMLTDIGRPLSCLSQNTLPIRRMASGRGLPQPRRSE